MAESEVIIMGGAPFSGKSTLAERLAAQQAYGLVALDDVGTAVCAVPTPRSHPALHPMAGWDDRAYYIAHTPATLIHHSRQEQDALWPAIAAVIHAHLQWAGHPGRLATRSRPHDVVDPPAAPCLLAISRRRGAGGLAAGRYGFLSGASDVERLIHHYLARSRWANDRVRRAAVYAASMVIHVGPEETVEALVTRCVQRLWPR
jgi:AAA domain